VLEYSAVFLLSRQPKMSIEPSGKAMALCNRAKVILNHNSGAKTCSSPSRTAHIHLAGRALRHALKAHIAKSSIPDA
jgi:hypothetical protein